VAEQETAGLAAPQATAPAAAQSAPRPDDWAIVVGVSRYWDNVWLKPLDGPLNDVALFTQWLTTTAGVDPSHLISITSPTPAPEDKRWYEYPPLGTQFENAFTELVTDGNGSYRFSPGRLYLYFAGHGFCLRRDIPTRTALYTANSRKPVGHNICGTEYALCAQANGFFAEVVLVMDCCRSAELNGSIEPCLIGAVPGGRPGKLLSVYAGEKGFSTPERSIPERDNKVHGLLTHAIMKVLEEGETDQLTGMSHERFKDELMNVWTDLWGGEPPDMPVVIPPERGDARIVLPSASQPVLQEFRVSGPVVFDIKNAEHGQFATCTILAPPGESRVEYADGHKGIIEISDNRFYLAMPRIIFSAVPPGQSLRDADVYRAGGRYVQL
jgi:hypothetical protein